MGSSKAALIKKLGSEEAYLAYMHQLAGKGGSKKVKKGMAVLTPEERSERGRLRAMARWGKRETNNPGQRPKSQEQ